MTVFLLCLTVFCAQAKDYYWTRTLMNGSRDHSKGTAAKETKLIESCQPQMTFLNEVVGFAPEAMARYAPQSPLGNWYADMLIHGGEVLSGEHCDAAILNTGGLRVDMPQGNILYGDIMAMFPFKNKICVLKMKGAKVWEVVDSMARNRFQIIGGMKAVVRDRRLESLEIGGKPVKMDSTYNVVTLDFLLGSGDKMFLRQRSDSVTIYDKVIFDYVMEYLRENDKTVISGKIDDRVVFLGEAPGKKSENTGKATSSSKAAPPDGYTLTILHTNDTHSHIVPIRGGSKDGLSGIEERAAFIDSVRRAEGPRNVLLLDAGDFSQGSPYFTIFGGKVEIEAMNIMKYDASTIGNHEWDSGVADLGKRLGKAKYHTVLTNYRIDDRRTQRELEPYVILRRGGKKIGILGVLTNISTTVGNEANALTHYENPAVAINRYSSFLKNEKKCDLVIVLSHCGFDGSEDNPGDTEMAPLLHDVDIIIGGHTHTNLTAPVYVKDADGNEVMIVTDYYWGIYVAEIKL